MISIQDRGTAVRREKKSRSYIFAGFDSSSTFRLIIGLGFIVQMGGLKKPH